jgi:hypothetical protein
MPDSPLDANVAPAKARRLAAFAAAQAAPDDWREVDLSILEEKRAAVPPFPLDLLPQPWRDWTSDTASSTAASVDYVAQTVLAALAGLCGAGVAVRILSARTAQAHSLPISFATPPRIYLSARRAHALIGRSKTIPAGLLTSGPLLCR